jgi:glycosyltransferase involved in cell wall biosynthesis
MWSFISPLTPFGYGVVSKNMVPRLMADGHEVIVSASQYVGAPMQFQGMNMISFLDSHVVSNLCDYFKTDYIFDLYNYKLPEQPRYRNWVMCAALDFPFMFDRYAAHINELADHVIAPSQHNIDAIKKFGFNPTYAPWGVDSKLFKPNAEMRKKKRDELKLGEDTFIVGTVGANIFDDRKNLFNTIRAFNKLASIHPDVALYIHCYLHSSLPLLRFIQTSGFADRIYYPDQRKIELMSIKEEEMVETYNAMDTFVCASKGESFCLPLVEAQACGVPAIVTDTTALPEMLYGGWTIPVDEDDYEYTYFGGWWAKVRAQSIFEQMEEAYQEWKAGTIFEKAKKAEKIVDDFDWDIVYDRHWRPLLKELEAKKCM